MMPEILLENNSGWRFRCRSATNACGELRYFPLVAINNAYYILDINRKV